MKLGAVDAICSLLEPRAYQGGTHSFDAVLEVAERNPLHKRPWMRELVAEMRKLAPPPIESITSFEHIPNIGIPSAMHDMVRQRVQEGRLLLREHGYLL